MSIFAKLFERLAKGPEVQLVDVPLDMPRDWRKSHAENVARIKPALQVGAVEFLRKDLAAEMPHIRELIAADPQEWWVQHHFGAMMGVRNRLRANGFGEKELGVDNLDDYAVGLVELAAGGTSPGSGKRHSPRLRLFN